MRDEDSLSGTLTDGPGIGNTNRVSRSVAKVICGGLAKMSRSPTYFEFPAPRHPADPLRKFSRQMSKLMALWHPWSSRHSRPSLLTRSHLLSSNVTAFKPASSALLSPPNAPHERRRHSRLRSVLYPSRGARRIRQAAPLWDAAASRRHVFSFS